MDGYSTLTILFSRKPNIRCISHSFVYSSKKLYFKENIKQELAIHSTHAMLDTQTHFQQHTVWIFLFLAHYDCIFNFIKKLVYCIYKISYITYWPLLVRNNKTFFVSYWTSVEFLVMKIFSQCSKCNRTLFENC